MTVNINIGDDYEIDTNSAGDLVIKSKTGGGSSETLVLSSTNLDVGGDVFVSYDRPLIELDGGADNQFAIRTWKGNNYNWSHETDPNGNRITLKNLTRGKDRIVAQGDGPAALNDEAGRPAFGASQQFGNALEAYSDTKVRIEDNELGTTAVEYITDPNKGTLRLLNANLAMAKNRIEFNGTGSQSTPSSSLTWPDQGGGNNPTLTVSGGGEITGYDDEGNATTIT